MPPLDAGGAATTAARRYIRLRNQLGIRSPVSVYPTNVASFTNRRLLSTSRTSHSSSSTSNHQARPSSDYDPRPEAQKPETSSSAPTERHFNAADAQRPEFKETRLPKLPLAPFMIERVKSRVSSSKKPQQRGNMNRGALHKEEGWQPKVQPDDPVDEFNEENTVKRKCAVLVGYAGTGYKGSQVNLGVETIEGDVFAALAAAGAVSKSNANNPNKVNMRRAARTDAGVHAATNVLSMKIELPPSVTEADKVEENVVVAQAVKENDPALSKSGYKKGLINGRVPLSYTEQDLQTARKVAEYEVDQLRKKVNQYLPSNIRVLGIVRLPRGFQARGHASSRQYEYIVPTFLFLPPRPGTTMHDKFQEFHAQARERGHDADTIDPEWLVTTKMPGWMHAGFEPEPPLPSWDFVLHHPLWEGLPPKPPAPPVPPIPEEYRARHQVSARRQAMEARAARDGTQVESDPEHEAQEEELIQRHWYRYWEDTRERTPDEKVFYDEVYARMKQFRLPEWQLERARRNLNMMIRKHNFHNFTVRRRFEDPSTWRVMKELTISEPFMGNDGIEYVSMRFHGVSFMLHQIRKMVAAVALLSRARTPSKIWYELFQNQRMLVPIAPAAGLFLESPIFDFYERDLHRRRTEHLILPTFNKIAPYDPQEVDTFKKERIYPHIFSAERQDRAFSKWIIWMDEHWHDLFGYMNPWAEVPQSCLLPELTGKMPSPTHPKTMRRHYALALQAAKAGKFEEQLEHEQEAEEAEDEDDDDDVEQNLQDAEVNGLMDEVPTGECTPSKPDTTTA